MILLKNALIVLKHSYAVLLHAIKLCVQCDSYREIQWFHWLDWVGLDWIALDCRSHTRCD